MTLNNANGTLSGFGGCNLFNGRYRLQGDKLDFTDLTVTTMACDQAGETEPRFLKALEELDEVRVEGRTLRGYNQGALIISFVADPLR
jgi:heat shock protein HslJ